MKVMANKSLVAMALISAAWPVTARAQEAACFDCHAGNGPNQRGSHEINQAKFAETPHAALGCTLCHSEGYAAFPHSAKEPASRIDCTQCHTGPDAPKAMGRIFHEVEASVHARKTGQGFACTACHNPHDFLPVSRMPSVAEAIRVANDACLACHAKAKEGQATAADAGTALAAKHTWIPNWRKHAESARCVECHTPGREDTVHYVMSARSAQRDCVECHSRDSLLVSKLYRHVAQEQRKAGFLNAVIVNDTYLIGATKNDLLDSLSVRLFGIALSLIGLHAAARIVMRMRRS